MHVSVCVCQRKYTQAIHGMISCHNKDILKPYIIQTHACKCVCVSKKTHTSSAQAHTYIIMRSFDHTQSIGNEVVHYETGYHNLLQVSSSLFRNSLYDWSTLFFLLLQKSHLHENRAVLCRLTYAGRVGADYKLMIIP